MPPKPKKKPLTSSPRPKLRPSSVTRITKAPKKKDKEAEAIAQMTIVQISKSPGMMSRLEQLEVELANLENSRAAVACSSGHASQQLAFASLLGKNDHFIASNKLYGGSINQFNKT